MIAYVKSILSGLLPRTVTPPQDTLRGTSPVMPAVQDFFIDRHGHFSARE